MEEILASIRRIISEDDDSAKRPPPAEPLVLKTPAPPAVAPDDDLVFEDDVKVQAPEPPPRIDPPRAPSAPVARAPLPPQPSAHFEADVEDSIVSGEAISAAAGSFTRLAGTLRLSDAPGQTLEGIVRELLRPMMKEWLDAHLPAIVEAKVEAELDRISRLAR
jgi:cell pole-organizing protein PopZ